MPCGLDLFHSSRVRCRRRPSRSCAPTPQAVETRNGGLEQSITKPSVPLPPLRPRSPYSWSHSVWPLRCSCFLQFLCSGRRPCSRSCIWRRRTPASGGDRGASATDAESAWMPARAAKGQTSRLHRGPQAAYSSLSQWGSGRARLFRLRMPTGRPAGPCTRGTAARSCYRRTIW